MRQLWFAITQRLMIWATLRAYHAAKAVGDDHEAAHILLGVATSQSKHKNGKCVFDFTAVNHARPEALALYYWEMNGMDIGSRT